MQFKMSLLFKVLFWSALIGSYIAAVVPQEMAPRIGTLGDKTVHFYAFAVLTLFLQFAHPMSSLKHLFFLTLYAVFIELSQYFTANRSAEFLDVVADMIGIGIGLLLYPVVQRWWRYYDHR